MGSIRYIGSKARIASAILDLIGPPGAATAAFVDLFSGTGAVSREAAQRGWNIRANDHLRSSAATTAAQLVSREHVPFFAFGGYTQVLRELASSQPVRGFVYREYTPSGESRTGHRRRYFTPENGSRIDGIRLCIEDWDRRCLLSEREKSLLLADLLGAANQVANIAGTYGCFLREWTASALRPLTLVPRTLLASEVQFTVSSFDAFEVAVESDDVVYLDPPYTKRQYAAYYHILETIAAGDAPQVEGVTGLRPWQEKSSPFCYKRKALRALDELVRRIPARTLYLSYSSEGHMALDSLELVLGMYGNVSVHPIADIGRYRPNRSSSNAASNVSEFLVELVKDRAVSRVAG